MEIIKRLFKGRIDRKNYALGILFYVLMAFLFAFVTAFLIDTFVYQFLYYPLLVAVFALGFSLHIRRFHDRGDSGWGVLFMLIPIVNIIFFLILLFEKGDEKENEFGTPIPKDAKFFDMLLGKK